MTIELTRILPDDALSVFRVRDMRPDEVITVTCDTVAEFNNSKRTAENARRTADRIDGYQYRVQTDSSRNTVTVSLYKKQRKEDDGNE